MLPLARAVTRGDQSRPTTTSCSTPLEDAGDGDDSESGSQVIALDTEGDEVGHDDRCPARAWPRCSKKTMDRDFRKRHCCWYDTVGVVLRPLGWWPAPRDWARALLVPESPYTTATCALGVSLFLLSFCGIMFDLLVKVELGYHLQPQ